MEKGVRADGWRDRRPSSEVDVESLVGIEPTRVRAVCLDLERTGQSVPTSCSDIEAFPLPSFLEGGEKTLQVV